MDLKVLKLGKLYLRVGTVEPHLFFIPFASEEPFFKDYEGETINAITFNSWESNLDVSEVEEVTKKEDMIYAMFIENKLKYKWEV